MSEEEYLQEVNWFEEQKNYKVITIFDLNDVEITILSPSDKSIETPEIIGGIELVKVWIKSAEKKIGEYPCEKLVISTHETFAGGIPGSVGIGGFGGFNHYWLLWHELTHSYFGTHSSEALWLREGASNVLPIIILEDEFYNIDWNEENYPKIPDIVESLEKGEIENQYINYSTEGWAGYDEGQVYFTKNACELEEPNQDSNQNYLENSYWGRVFLLDLSLRFGKQTVTDTLKAVYAKYRYTNLTKITDKDFYDAFLYYAPKDNTTAVNKYQEAKEFLGEKLCIED